MVGALQLTCSDEAEHEVASVFQRDFVRALLPALHFDDKAPFRTANLGARYEWGSAGIAEHHFALAPGAEAWKLMVLKLNAHVGVDQLAGEPRYGRLSRYGSPSTCCGFLHALLDGATNPLVREAAELLEADGVDRLSALRALPPDQRALHAAATSARLQARRAMLDVQNHPAASPTVYLILPCVSFNRRNHDSEMLLGVYVCDRRGPEPHDEYCGLGDRPEHYRLTDVEGSVVLEDDDMHTPRPARDHRRLVREAWSEKRGSLAPPRDARLARALETARARPRDDHHLARAALKGLLGAAIAVAPVPAALVLFGEGALAIHHVTEARRLLREAEGDPVARAMLGDLQARIDALDPAEAQHLIELLVHEYGE